MRNSRFVIVGSSGMLGRELADACSRLGAPADLFPGRKSLDIGDEAQIKEVSGAWRGAIVINAAGYTDVDAAETNADAADRANHLGSRHLARACAGVGATLVQYSSDYLFDGRATLPIPIDAHAGPLNEYGRSKLAGERAVLASGCRHLIIRTSWLYAEHGRNFVRTIRGLASSRDSLTVVNDQRGRPTYARDLAGFTLALVRKDACGVLHATNDGACTWFEFAASIVSGCGLRCRVEPCHSSNFPRPARRPAFSVLDIEGTKRLIGAVRPWRDALAECLDRLHSAQTPALRAA